ncbi:MAG TPA: hypothetical protein PKI62_06105 [bacterium]|nr:hypothetical protein [bacterium]HPR86472.1 hypothetical protein [bacterium]
MSASRYFLFFILLLGGSTLLQAQTLQRVTASPLTPGSPAVLRFEWDNAGPLTPRARLGWVLPADFDRTLLLLAASQSINGGFSVANSGDTLWVARSGAGERIPAAGRLDLAIASIGLPADLERSWPLVFLLQDSSRRVTLNATMTLSRP